MNFWQFLNNVFLMSMQKGQLLPAVFGLSIIIMMLRIPTEDLSKVAGEFITLMNSQAFFGYPMSGILVVSWFYHSKSQRKRWSNEMERVAKERDRAQGSKIGNHKIKTSKPR